MQTDTTRLMTERDHISFASSLERILLIWNHLTGYTRLLARRVPCRGLYDNKGIATQSGERVNPAFGGSGGSILSRGALVQLALCAVLLALTVPPSSAAEPIIPSFWDTKERLRRPNLPELPRLRFLTTIDYPPFNFLDKFGRLSGFHIDLARAICAELELEAKCQIQALPWEELQAALEAGQGEAILAGVAVTEEARRTYAFSRSFLHFSARLLTPKTAVINKPLYKGIAGKRIGVMDNSSHERMLRTYFPDAKTVIYNRREWLLGDMKDGKIDGVFGDGVRLSFWMSGSDSAGCCIFSGGPYLAPEYFGNGLAIATLPDNKDLISAFNHALREIETKGVFAELYLRYFPVSFF